MEAKKNSSSPVNDDLCPPSNYNEISMQRSLLFADSLKDLRNIRSQLYSAAEFFEDRYHKLDHDQLLLEQLKDYVSKALINTVDHLGSVASKVNSILDENADEVYKTNLRVLCIDQRLQTCHMHGDHEGLLQQSSVMHIPKYHKQYLLPESQFSEDVKAEKAKTESSGLVSFSFANAAWKKESEKRSPSVSPSRVRIKRSGSAVHRPNTQKHLAEAWSDGRKDIEVYSKKTRNLFKALLSMHKYKNDSKLC